MARVAYESIEVNRCTGCDGLWFDMLEEEHLKAIAHSEEIDIGDPKVGRSFDAVDRIDCPVCHTRMMRMVDARQPHIRYESCQVCYGVFFDAGEFRDYRQETVLDFFRSLFAKERR
jgi:Zn-finger nucleic acid-binding protein